MTNEILKSAIDSAVNNSISFCKFLTANDTGATGGHQSGILVSKAAKDLLFPRVVLEGIQKREVKIKWQMIFLQIVPLHIIVVKTN